MALQAWARGEGLPGLAAQGVSEDQHADIALAALEASSMRGNPVRLDAAALVAVLRQA